MHEFHFNNFISRLDLGILVATFSQFSVSDWVQAGINEQNWKTPPQRVFCVLSPTKVDTKDTKNPSWFFSVLKLQLAALGLGLIPGRKGWRQCDPDTGHIQQLLIALVQGKSFGDFNIQSGLKIIPKKPDQSPDSRV